MNNFFNYDFYTSSNNSSINNLIGGTNIYKLINIQDLPNESEILPNSRLNYSKYLEIGKSKIIGAGNGVYSLKNYKIGDIVDMCPTVRVLRKYLKEPDNSLRDYYFSDTDPSYGIIVFGNGSIFNHSDNPHVLWKMKDDYMVYYAVKDINIGDEIYTTYGSEWFKFRNIAKQ